MYHSSPLGIVTDTLSLSAAFDSGKWAAEQSGRWQSGSMRSRINQTREVAAKLNVELPAVDVPLNLVESKAFVTAYAAEHGIPTTTAQVQRLTASYALAQARRAGVTPEMIAAGELILHPPTTVAEGVAWGEGVAKGYAESMGIPLNEEGLVKAGAGMASAQLGVDPAIIDTGISILKDGKVDSTDVANLAVAAATYACASLGQAIGLPAPIGAMIGSFVSKTIVGVIVHIAGPQERDLMDKAWKAAEKARAARKAECEQAGKEAWTAYVDFWAETLGRLQALLDQPEIAVALQAAGGVKYFHRSVPSRELVDPLSLLLPAASYQWYLKLHPGGSGEPRVSRYPDVLYRRPSCVATDPTTNRSAPRKDGCFYFPETIATWGTEWAGLSEFQRNIRMAAQRQQLSAGQRQADVAAGPMVVRTDYRNYSTPFHRATFQVTLGGKVNGRPNARALLKFWGVEEFPTFAPTNGRLSDAESVKAASYVPQQWIGAHGKIRQMGDCDVPGQVELLQANMRDAAVAASEVMQDVVQTVAWQVATAAIEQTKREAQEKAALAVQARGQLLQLAALSPAQRQRLTDWQALAKLSPAEQAQLVEYARLAKAAEPAQQPLSLAVAGKADAAAVQARLNGARRLRWAAVGAVVLVGGTWLVAGSRRKS